MEWPDTDAAGHYHHSTILRWVEAAEAELLDSVGLRHLFGIIPRVHYSADYNHRLWFGDIAEIHIAVTRMGRTSMTYAITVTVDSAVAATATLTAVHSPGEGGAQPWPASVTSRLRAIESTPDGSTVHTNAKTIQGTPQCA